MQILNKARQQYENVEEAIVAAVANDSKENVEKRFKSTTPKKWRKVKRISGISAVVLGAIGTVIASGGIVLPVWVGYVLLGSTALAKGLHEAAKYQINDPDLKAQTKKDRANRKVGNKKKRVQKKTDRKFVRVERKNLRKEERHSRKVNKN